MFYNRTDITEKVLVEVDSLLALISAEIQLPPHKYDAMIGRKRNVEQWLERDGSPLKGCIRYTYLQGSVPIGATIRSISRGDGYDIDIVAELSGTSISPRWALDALYDAIRGEAGTRYFDKVERKSRCVSVKFSDNMHLDITPTELIDINDPRLSYLLQSKLDKLECYEEKIITNAYAFVQEYNDVCSKNSESQELVARFLSDAYMSKGKSNKDTTIGDLPPYSAVPGGLSPVTAALQLLKRYRDRCWSNRSTRKPPSVMLSCFALYSAQSSYGIYESLIDLVDFAIARLQNAEENNVHIEVVNPRCLEDNFTDRWPETRSDQRQFLEDLKYFLKQIRMLRESNSVKERCNILSSLFGDNIVRRMESVYLEYLGNSIRTGKDVVRPFCGIAPLSAPVAMPTSAEAIPARPNTFYGNVELDLLTRGQGTHCSLSSQVESMRTKWPQLICTRGQHPMHVRWKGELYGNNRKFLVSIDYGLPMPNNSDLFRIMPLVRVLQPQLVPIVDAAEEAPLPHVYFTGPILEYSALCLFDPHCGQWNHSMLISDTTVPWTVRWLACCEIWEEYGKWIGGGISTTTRLRN